MIQIKEPQHFIYPSEDDQYAVHVNKALEIEGIDEKLSLDPDDLFILEDSTSSPTAFIKKKVRYSKLGVITAQDVGVGIDVYIDDSTSIYKFQRLYSTSSILDISQGDQTVEFGIIPSNIDIDTIGDGTLYKKYLNDERNKLTGIEALADVTDIWNVTNALGSISVSAMSDIFSSGNDIEVSVSLKHVQGTDTTLGVMEQILDMGGYRIQNSDDPIYDTDLVTKRYLHNNVFDANAIHVNTSDEIHEIYPSMSMEDSDVFVLETEIIGTSSVWTKRRVPFSVMRAGFSDEDAIHYNKPNEYVRAPVVTETSMGDLFLIEVPDPATGIFDKHYITYETLSGGLVSGVFHYHKFNEFGTQMYKKSPPFDAGDRLAIEDWNDGYTKKYIEYGDLTGDSTDPKAIHYDGVGEFDTIVHETTVAGTDVFIIEKPMDATQNPGEKRKITFNQIPTGHDAGAVHMAGTNEFAGVARKASDLDASYLLLEESEEQTVSNRVKKRVRISDLPTGGGGQVNYGINVGNGYGIYHGKNGSGLNFKSIKGGESVYVKKDGDDTYKIYLDYDELKGKLNLHLRDVSNDGILLWNDRKSSLTEHIEWHTAFVTSLAASAGVAWLTVSMTALEAEVAGLTAQVETLEGEMTIVKADITTIKGKLGRFKVKTIVSKNITQFASSSIVGNLKTQDPFIAEQNFLRLSAVQRVDDQYLSLYLRIEHVVSDHGDGEGLNIILQNTIVGFDQVPSHNWPANQCYVIQNKKQDITRTNYLLNILGLSDGWGIEVTYSTWEKDEEEIYDSLLLSLNVICQNKNNIVPVVKIPDNIKDEAYEPIEFYGLGPWYDTESEYDWEDRVRVLLAGGTLQNTDDYLNIIPIGYNIKNIGDPDVTFNLVSVKKRNVEAYADEWGVRRLRQKSFIELIVQEGEGTADDKSLLITLGGVLTKTPENVGWEVQPPHFKSLDRIYFNDELEEHHITDSQRMFFKSIGAVQEVKNINIYGQRIRVVGEDPVDPQNPNELFQRLCLVPHSQQCAYFLEPEGNLQSSYPFIFTSDEASFQEWYTFYPICVDPAGGLHLDLVPNPNDPAPNAAYIKISFDGGGARTPCKNTTLGGGTILKRDFDIEENAWMFRTFISDPDSIQSAIWDFSKAYDDNHITFLFPLFWDARQNKAEGVSIMSEWRDEPHNKDYFLFYGLCSPPEEGQAWTERLKMVFNEIEGRIDFTPWMTVVTVKQYNVNKWYALDKTVDYIEGDRLIALQTNGLNTVKGTIRIDYEAETEDFIPQLNDVSDPSFINYFVVPFDQVPVPTVGIDLTEKIIFAKEGPHKPTYHFRKLQQTMLPQGYGTGFMHVVQALQDLSNPNPVPNPDYLDPEYAYLTNYIFPKANITEIYPNLELIVRHDPSGDQRNITFSPIGNFLSQNQTDFKNIMNVGKVALEEIPLVGVAFEMISLAKSKWDKTNKLNGKWDLPNKLNGPTPQYVWWGAEHYDDGGMVRGNNIVFKYIAVNNTVEEDSILGMSESTVNLDYPDDTIVIDIYPNNIHRVGVQAQPLDMGTNKIGNLGTATQSEDDKAVNVELMKSYVDQELNPLREKAHYPDHDDGTDPLDEDLDLGGDEAQGEGIVIPHRVVNMKEPSFEIDHHGVNVYGLRTYPGVKDALHTYAADEISSLPEKIIPGEYDWGIIEDADDGYKKKKVKLGSVIDPKAIHVDKSAEIYGIPIKPQPSGDDILVIEDHSTGFEKKKISINALPLVTQYKVAHRSSSHSTIILTNDDFGTLYVFSPTNNPMTVTLPTIEAWYQGLSFSFVIYTDPYWVDIITSPTSGNTISLYSNVYHMHSHSDKICITLTTDGLNNWIVTSSNGMGVTSSIRGGSFSSSDWLPQYTNNADALNHGLIDGDLYRTDDVLKVTHDDDLKVTS